MNNLIQPDIHGFQADRFPQNQIAVRLRWYCQVHNLVCTNAVSYTHLTLPTIYSV